MIWRKNISVLHIDDSAGLAVGLALFAFAGWVSELYQLPLNTILFLASANTIYGCYALALALSNKNRRVNNRTQNRASYDALYYF